MFISVLKYTSRLAVVCCLLLPSAASAQTLFEYDSSAANATADPTISPINVASGITPTLFSAGSGVDPVFGQYTWEGWDSTITTAAEGIAANDFWTWGFTADSTAVDLTDLSFALQRSGNGPNDVEVLASVNGGTAVSILSDSFGGSVDVETFNADGIGSVPTLNVGDSVQFILAGLNSNDTFGTLSLQTQDGSTSALTVSGNSVAVPEPASASLLALGLAGVALVRRRRS